MCTHQICVVLDCAEARNPPKWPETGRTTQEGPTKGQNDPKIIKMARKGLKGPGNHRNGQTVAPKSQRMNRTAGKAPTQPENQRSNQKTLQCKFPHQATSPKTGLLPTNLVLHKHPSRGRGKGRGKRGRGRGRGSTLMILGSGLAKHTEQQGGQMGEGYRLRGSEGFKTLRDSLPPSEHSAVLTCCVSPLTCWVSP